MATDPQTAEDADDTVRCPLCADALTLHTPTEAREHFTTAHPEWPLVGPGPWPKLGMPPTDRVGLRELIAGALSEARRPGLGGMTEADAVAYMAAAVLPVLPDTARLHDEILTLRADQAKMRDLLRKQNKRANSAIDRETTAEEAEEEQRLALSEALGLGTSAPWDAIRERAAELAGLPATVDRAAVLREAADLIEARQDRLDAEERAKFDWLDHETVLQGAAVRDMATYLREQAEPKPAVTLPGKEAKIPCAEAFWSRTPHTPHDWRQQPGMSPVHCPGVAAVSTEDPQ